MEVGTLTVTAEDQKKENEPSASRDGSQRAAPQGGSSGAGRGRQGEGCKSSSRA